jgi:hypothetical protein
VTAPRPTAELSRYGRTQRALELAGVSLFIALLSLQVNEALQAPIPHLLLLALAAWITADLLSGIAHWAFDNFGRLDTPLLGPAFIRPFREHHADPQAMTRHDFVETNGASCLAYSPLLLVSLSLEDAATKAFLVFLGLGILATNQCHKWAHQDSVSVFIHLLQRMNFILKPEIHGRHHSAPYRSHYCTASGWMNPVLDALLKAK